ncbi:hypothetical protein N7532_007011 [Penicillium argentinense]|uniref:MJ1316 RNA cyclic group end recognition domain-containing protein n=1 Tax=Penicillium argentinense TaxID=1131581 RepID=A0A9W9FGX2_9EURO|nr:uncharacterized protein N7532_007011 [Penicillium argentinense]KAJ5100010.1 hypothetical protein N7532_007011 [Penicillium argentinense]
MASTSPISPSSTLETPVEKTDQPNSQAHTDATLRKVPDVVKVRRSRSPPERNSRAGENRLRPAGDLINRITWDSKFNHNDYIIGFVDRFEGRLEITLDKWKKESTDEEFIPQHRVLYIRHVDGEIVWDRRRRIDAIFSSGNSAFRELAFLQ